MPLCAGSVVTAVNQQPPEHSQCVWWGALYVYESNLPVLVGGSFHPPILWVGKLAPKGEAICPQLCIWALSSYPLPHCPPYLDCPSPQGVRLLAVDTSIPSRIWGGERPGPPGSWETGDVAAGSIQAARMLLDCSWLLGPLHPCLFPESSLLCLPLPQPSQAKPGRQRKREGKSDLRVFLHYLDS